MAKIIYVGPTDLRDELKELIRSKGLSAKSTASSQEPGCDYETTSLHVEQSYAVRGDLEHLCHEAVAEWNAKYPPYGIWIDG